MTTPDKAEIDEVDQAIREMIAEDEILKQLGFQRVDEIDKADFLKVKLSRPDGNPSIKGVVAGEIRKTTNTYIGATLLRVGKPGSDEVSHEKLVLARYRRKGGGGYDFSTRVEEFNLEDAELDKLGAFLAGRGKVVDNGQFVLVPVDRETRAQVEAILGAIEDGELPAAEFVGMLKAFAESAVQLEALAAEAPEEVSRAVAAALSLAQRRKAIGRLDAGLTGNEQEKFFQSLLEENWWMLGNRYVGRLERRDYTTDETVDLPLVRADGFAEIIELKRADAEVLKKMEGRWLTTAEVNDAVNQVGRYISEVERQVDTLRAKYKVDFFKVAGRIVIGRIPPDDPDGAEKRKALRQYNSHLHRIEILTYDDVRARAASLVDLDERVAARDPD